MTDISRHFEALRPAAEGNPAAMLAMAQAMRKNGQAEAALETARKALELARDNGEIAARARVFLSGDVPGWHFVIVRDVARNSAYDSALRAAVTPETRVLEIGAGTGLLAMMAARAGAAEVMTCEMNPTIAGKAAEIIARNGYAGTTRVIAKHSQKLDVEADLGGRVDVLVSEIVSNNLLGEDALPAHEHAVRELLKPGGRVIPARGAVRVALAEYGGDEKGPLGEIDGFDLSPFNDLMAPVRHTSVGKDNLVLRGEAADMFSFDFASAAFCHPARRSLELRSDGGRVNGVAQWIALDMDGTHAYENRPAPGATSCWAALFYPLPAPVETLAGQIVRVNGFHDRRRVWIWGDEAGQPARSGA